MKRNTIMFIIILLFLTLAICGCSTRTDSNDGKCDICGKKVYKKLNGEEFCKKDYEEAEKWYVKRAVEKYSE